MPDIARLIAVLEEARVLVARPGNDFAWSSWQDEAAALQEIDTVLEKLRAEGIEGGNKVPVFAEVLFLPTGPLQELGLSSGWGDEYVALADRFDEALYIEPAGDAPRASYTSPSTCPCRTPQTNILSAVRELGQDAGFAEVSVYRCNACGQHWLRYYYVDEAISRSGRWFRGALTPEQAATLTVAEARPTLEAMDEYFYGGSYYDGNSGTTSGELNL